MNPAARVIRWVKAHLVLGLGLLVLVYMFVPIAVVVLMSFNDPGKSKNVYKFRSFTLDNWMHPCHPAGMCHAVGISMNAALSLASARSSRVPCGSNSFRSRSPRG